MRLTRHRFADDYLLNCVYRLTEIVKRYECLTGHLLVAAYDWGGDDTVTVYVDRIEARLLQEALTAAEGNMSLAAKLVGSPHLLHFQRACQRVGVILPRRQFARDQPAGDVA